MFSELEGGEKENHPLRGGTTTIIKRLLLNTFRKASKNVVMVILILLVTVTLLSIFSSPSSAENNKAQKGANKSTTQLKMHDNTAKENELRQKEREIQIKLDEVAEKERQLAVLQEQFDQQQEVLDQQRKQLEEVDKLKASLRDQQRELEAFRNQMKSEDKGQSNDEDVGTADVEKRDEAFLHAWKGYKDNAWGQDEVKPVDGTVNNWMGLGLTIVDSLDTLWIMDLKDEFADARAWVAANLNFEVSKTVSFFETTIRVLGGMLSAYELSGDTMFLEKADDLGTRFLPAFDSRSGLPRTSINLLSGGASNPSWTGGAGILAEMATVQLEFYYLANKTNKPIYREKALKVYDHLDSIPKHSGLYSIYINTDSGHFTRNHITLGAMGDSFYEYLIKIWLLSGKTLPKYKKMYDEAVDNIKRYLIKRSQPSNLMYIAELIDGNTVDKMDHLVCFAGAMFAVGAEDSPRSDDMDLAKGVTATCNEMYRRTATGIGSEIVNFVPGQDFIVPSTAKHYLLRPEAVESFFVLWRKTHDPIYREMGWKAFKAIDKYCKTTHGYSGIRDVTSTTPYYDNVQQSFFLAETLKDSLIPLDKYVFNTEAHPLGVLK